MTYKGIPIRLSVDFSAETLQVRLKWQDAVTVMKKKIYNQDYSQQGSHSVSMEKLKAS